MLTQIHSTELKISHPHRLVNPIMAKIASFEGFGRVVDGKFTPQVPKDLEDHQGEPRVGHVGKMTVKLTVLCFHRSAMRSPPLHRFHDRPEPLYILFLAV